MKSFTKFGTPIETNLDEGLHKIVVNLIEKLERYYLDVSKGEFTIHDVAKEAPAQLKEIAEMLDLKVECNKMDYSKNL